MENIQVVIARYNEPIEWIKQLKHPFVVYNKGAFVDFPHTYLPNIGREAHTMLFHIVNNYHRLPTYTVFLQGNPFDHNQNVIDNINNFPNSKDNLYHYSDGCYSLADRHLEEKIEDMYKYGVFIDAIYDKHFFVPKDTFHFACGAQYIVHQKNIINKPKALYESLLKTYQWLDHEPWSIERVWPMIFDANDSYKNKY